MITLKISTDLESIKRILFDKKLAELTHDDLSPPDIDTFALDSNTLYLLAYSDNNDLVGMFRLTHLTGCVIIVHIHVLPSFWGTGVGDEMADTLLEKSKDVPNARKLVAFVPKTATKVTSLLFRHRFNFAGILKKAVMFNNSLVDLHIFEFDLKR